MGRFLPSAFERVAPRLDRPFRSAEELLEHYRGALPARVGDFRLDEVGPIMPHDEPGEADALVAGRFHLGESTVDMGGSLDWFAAPDGDLEWNGGLVRHGHLKILAREYQRTRREVYAEAAVAHLLDYIERVPPFDPEGKPYIEYKRSTWRPFEVAARAAENWPEALRLLIASPAMTPSAWATILCSVGEHADFLLRHHWETGNHATLETADLGLIGVFYPEFRDAPHWRAYAADFLMRMWDVLFHPDGYTREMSGGYQWVALRSYLAFYEAGSRGGHADLFPALYRSRLDRAAWAEFFQDKPDFSVPVTNDSNASINRRAQLEQMARLFSFAPFRKRLDGAPVDADAIPSAGPLQCSRSGSVFFPEARIAVMRGGWGPKDAYLFMDMGRWGDNHMNEDQLHVEVHALGRNFLCGSGRWRYTTSDPRASWMRKARYFKTTAAYNAVLVDGCSQMPADARGSMVPGESFDFADGLFEAGFGEESASRDGADEKHLKEKGLSGSKVLRVAARHRRRVFFIKPHAWLVRDDLSFEDGEEHRIDQVWHFSEGRLEERGPGRWSTSFPEANLLVATDAPLPGTVFHGSDDPIAGWHCPRYDCLQPAAELRLEARGRGVITIHTLLYPVASVPPGILPRLAARDGFCSVRLAEGDFVIDCPAEGAWRLV